MMRMITAEAPAFRLIPGRPFARRPSERAA